MKQTIHNSNIRKILSNFNKLLVNLESTVKNVLSMKIISNFNQRNIVSNFNKAKIKFHKSLTKFSNHRF